MPRGCGIPWLITMLIALLCEAAPRAQTTTPTAPTTNPTAGSVRVSLITMGPGQEIWEQWGHNAILIEDPATGLAAAYNYGLFDFDQPNFIGRFILGRMTYAMDAEYAGPMLKMYVEDDRDIIVQELNLTPDQAQRLWDFLEWNRRPQNRDYLYEYYRSNCSTKVRDALDRADVLGGQLHAQLQQVRTGTTYRWHTRIGSSRNALLYTGLEFALGRPTDRELSAWEEAFVPMELARQLRRVTVRDPITGQTAPLVKNEQVLHRSTRPPLPSRPPFWTWAYLLIGLAFAAGMLGAARLTTATDARRAKRGRIAFGILAVAWSLVSGLAGAFLVFALTTDHTAAHYNNNLLVFPPLSLLLVVFAVSAVRRGKYARAARWTGIIVLAHPVLGLLANAIPALRQWNWDMIALALPVHAALAWALFHVVARAADRPSARVGSAAGGSRQNLPERPAVRTMRPKA